MIDVGGGPIEVFRIDLGPDDGVLWVPVGRLSVEGIRLPADEDHVEEAWELIPVQEAPKKRTNWNRRHRRYQEMLMSNQPKQLAELIGELVAVREAKREKRQTLSFQGAPLPREGHPLAGRRDGRGARRRGRRRDRGAGRADPGRLILGVR